MRLAIMIALMFTLLSAESREALLIGNSNYQYITNLDDPSSNLKRLKKTLEGLDFNAKIETNLNSENLEASIDDFAKRLSKNSDSIGFLYYTGHGCQVDYQGYLIPTNVNTKIKRKIKYNAMNINEMLEILKDAGNRVNMVFLDACRDVPTGAKGGTKGLGQPVARPKGSLIVYATEAGKVANDNSKFINSLIENISKPNQSIRNIGDNISNDVAQKSAYAQIPEVYTKLLPSMVLKSGRGGYVSPKPRVVPAPKPIFTSKWITPTKEEVTWKKAKELCSVNGGRLPTIEELKKVVMDCGGTITTFSDKNWESLTNKNKANKLYQACYKAKGFDYNYYWSSSTFNGFEDVVRIVHFNMGYVGGEDNKDDSTYVRCVRDGQ
jgi:hypothetical protein